MVDGAADRIWRAWVGLEMTSKALTQAHQLPFHHIGPDPLMKMDVPLAQAISQITLLPARKTPRFDILTMRSYARASTNTHRRERGEQTGRAQVR